MKKNMVIMLTLLAFSSMAFVRVEAASTTLAKDVKDLETSVLRQLDKTISSLDISTFTVTIARLKTEANKLRLNITAEKQLKNSVLQTLAELEDILAQKRSASSLGISSHAASSNSSDLSSSFAASGGDSEEFSKPERAALESKDASQTAFGASIWGESDVESDAKDARRHAAFKVEQLDSGSVSGSDYSHSDPSEEETNRAYAFSSQEFQPHSYRLTQDNSTQIQELAGRIAQQSALLFASTGASDTSLEYLIAYVLKQAVHEGLTNAQSKDASPHHTVEYYHNIIRGFLNEVARYSAVPYTTLDSGAVNRIGESVTAELYRIAESLSKMPKAMSPDKRQAVAAELILFKINKMAEKEGISKPDTTNYPQFVIAFLERMFHAQIQECTSRQALAITKKHITAILNSIASQMLTQEVNDEILDRIFDKTNGIDTKVTALIAAKYLNFDAPESLTHRFPPQFDYSPRANALISDELDADLPDLSDEIVSKGSWRRTEERPEAAALLVDEDTTPQWTDEDTTPQWTEETTDPYNKFLGKPVKSKNVYSGLQKWKKDRLKPAARR